MKKVIALFVLVGFASSSFIATEPSNLIQTDSVDEIIFSQMTFEQALKEAKKTGKLIFLDAYTDWCGPCKKMSAHTFTDPAVAKLFNSKFINLKIEMEKNPDGPEIARKYAIRAYPSLLFLDGNGKVIKYVVGYQNPDQLIAVGKSL
ncbi:MAG: thioredoxin family protein [Crocinitomicaceae bacterium]|nr:thioredoxin family protein [Crocinitomicaceae bacterium]